MALALMAAMLVSHDVAAQPAVGGDVDCDGAVTIGDAIRLTEFVIGHAVDAPCSAGELGDPVRADTAAGDIDADGSISTIDAMYLVQCALGFPSVIECPR